MTKSASGAIPLYSPLAKALPFPAAMPAVTVPCPTASRSGI
jgi:hypothetical protein